MHKGKKNSDGESLSDEHAQRAAWSSLNTAQCHLLCSQMLHYSAEIKISEWCTLWLWNPQGLLSLLKIIITDTFSTAYMQITIYNTCQAGVWRFSQYFDSQRFLLPLWQSKQHPSQHLQAGLVQNPWESAVLFPCEESPQANAPTSTWFSLPVVIISQEAHKVHGFYSQSTALEDWQRDYWTDTVH